jgi:hypothetical protein
MYQIKIIKIFLILGLVLPSCITPYEPQIESKDINKYVVSGQVTDESEYQTVSISMGSPVNDPQYIPVSGCSVIITDDKKNRYLLQESSTVPGNYAGKVDSYYLKPGIAFKIDIITPDGTSIESDFDRIPQCPDVDDVYYEITDLVSEVTGEVTRGIQFYIDLNGENVNNRFYKWEVTETWEHHVDYPREWYYDGTVHHIYPPDYSRMVCWSTETVKDIYTLSTENLDENRYEKYSLNFVSNLTSKLLYGYSLLVNQIAMSEEAYSYWDQMRINSTEQGGLYEKQPLSITGNLHNTTDPSQDVLGYFSASSVKSKRIFVREVENLEILYGGYCTPAFLKYGFREISPSDYPAFLMGDKEMYYMILLGSDCVDCLFYGGTNIKPGFWPY